VEWWRRVQLPNYVRQSDDTHQGGRGWHYRERDFRCGGVLAAQRLPDMSTQLEARAPVLKAGKPVVWSSHDKVTIR